MTHVRSEPIEITSFREETKTGSCHNLELNLLFRSSQARVLFMVISPYAPVLARVIRFRGWNTLRRSVLRRTFEGRIRAIRDAIPPTFYHKDMIEKTTGVFQFMN